MALKLRGQHGYAMVALLVAMSVGAVLMSALMPAWKTMVRREKEAELVFRGEQYTRAIALFQRRAGPGVLPPSLDALVAQKFLRKKFKDPITGQDFDVLAPDSVAAPPGRAAPAGAGVPGTAPQGRGAVPGNPGSVGGPASQTPLGRGGVTGVVSKSRDASLRAYNGRTRYNEWLFVYVPQVQSPVGGRGVPPGGVAAGTQAGLPGTGRGGRGAPVQGRGTGSPPGSVQPAGARGGAPAPATRPPR